MIVERSAGVFNVRGYAGASVADLMSATGLEKGGLYRHFPSKLELAVEAFEYAAGLLRRRLRGALVGVNGPRAQLLAFVDAFEGLALEPPVVGGCPVLNTAIEADDTEPALRDRARAVMLEWRETLEEITLAGKAARELRADVDAAALASVIAATLEGSVMLSKLYGDPVHVRRAAAHLRGYIQSVSRGPRRAKPGGRA